MFEGSMAIARLTATPGLLRRTRSGYDAGGVHIDERHPQHIARLYAAPNRLGNVRLKPGLPLLPGYLP